MSREPERKRLLGVPPRGVRWRLGRGTLVRRRGSSRRARCARRLSVEPAAVDRAVGPPRRVRGRARCPEARGRRRGPRLLGVRARARRRGAGRGRPSRSTRARRGATRGAAASPPSSSSPAAVWPASKNAARPRARSATAFLAGRRARAPPPPRGAWRASGRGCSPPPTAARRARWRGRASPPRRRRRNGLAERARARSRACPPPTPRGRGEVASRAGSARGPRPRAGGGAPSHAGRVARPPHRRRHRAYVAVRGRLGRPPQVVRRLVIARVPTVSAFALERREVDDFCCTSTSPPRRRCDLEQARSSTCRPATRARRRRRPPRIFGALRGDLRARARGAGRASDDGRRGLHDVVRRERRPSRRATGSSCTWTLGVRPQRGSDDVDRRGRAVACARWLCCIACRCARRAISSRSRAAHRPADSAPSSAGGHARASASVATGATVPNWSATSMPALERVAAPRGGHRARSTCASRMRNLAAGGMCPSRARRPRPSVTTPRPLRFASATRPAACAAARGGGGGEQRPADATTGRPARRAPRRAAAARTAARWARSFARRKARAPVPLLAPRVAVGRARSAASPAPTSAKRAASTTIWARNPRGRRSSDEAGSMSTRRPRRGGRRDERRARERDEPARRCRAVARPPRRPRRRRTPGCAPQARRELARRAAARRAGARRNRRAAAAASREPRPRRRRTRGTAAEIVGRRRRAPAPAAEQIPRRAENGARAAARARGAPTPPAPATCARAGRRVARAPPAGSAAEGRDPGAVVQIFAAGGREAARSGGDSRRFAHDARAPPPRTARRPARARSASAAEAEPRPSRRASAMRGVEVGDAAAAELPRRAVHPPRRRRGGASQRVGAADAPCQRRRERVEQALGMPPHARRRARKKGSRVETAKTRDQGARRGRRARRFQRRRR